ncbi:oligosaccharide flippase family protein [Scleromatobacter humisilvae]|uniref:Oligosaccharide flippase family protein n=1 Tax=Scleromatobacter humisilvae TaxID=2897159 RepID=A0A9X1YH18_9BURK|nr:oligosaccharide flippase family protein [Scleromatobacter humisilvae]MCK9686349.1 oligosaccharide flippase family protein [Scleromatobacter humisilvae]
MTVRRALAFTYIEKYGSFLLSLGSTAVISRLLKPADIGVFAIGMSLVGVVAVVRELGVSTYLVQEAELSERRIRAAFTLAVMMGLGLCLLLLALSIPAGAFYKDSNVTTIVCILALNFALTPLGSVSQSLLTRELRFSTLTWIRLAQSAVLAGASIALAQLGWGSLSLAWGAVLSSLANSILSLWIRPHPMRPTFDGAELRRVFSVGGPATAVSVVDEIVSSMPELVLGRTQTLAAAGLFSRARGMSQMAHQLLARAAGPVFLAVFAERQREGVPLAPLYAKATACVLGLGWVALAMLVVLAEPVVRALFGPNWLAVVSPMRWLSAAAAMALVTSGAYHLLLASGGVRDVLRAKVATLPAQALPLVIGAFLGVTWMAIAMVLSSIVASLLLGLAVRARSGISLRDQLKPAIVSIPIALAGAVGASLGLMVAAPYSALGAFEELLIGGSAGVVFAAGSLMAGKHPLRGEVAMLLMRFRHAG